MQALKLVLLPTPPLPREIGVRVALGPTRGEVTATVLRETCVLVGLGMAIGIALALGTSRLIASWLYGLRPSDPLAIATAAGRTGEPLSPYWRMGRALPGSPFTFKWTGYV